MFYYVKTPWWMKKLYNGAVWQIPGREKVIYLSFDDGPHPSITPFVLDELKKYKARATFFCLGRNLLENPGVYKRILEEGHAVGNHSFSHLNGWKTKASIWLNDVAEAGKYIDTGLFRPPYGKITRLNLKVLAGKRFKLTTVMWTVLSGDFDTGISPENCYANVIKNATSGDIIVFHDSEKALVRMKYALPGVLKYFIEKGYRFEKIVLNSG